MTAAQQEAAMAAAQQLMRGNIHCADDRLKFRARKAELIALLDDPTKANDLITQACHAHALGFVVTTLAPIQRIAA